MVAWSDTAPSSHICSNDATRRIERMTTRPPLAEKLDLKPHPEGGWYRETYRSKITFNPGGYAGPRAAATGIYFLLPPGEFSAWHVVRSDELWFLHSGSLELRFGGTGAAPAEA